MKKLFIFCSSIFISLLLSAQKTTVKTTAGTNFCKGLSKVMANAPDNFIKIQIERADAIPDKIYFTIGSYLGSGWNTSLPFPGALKSFIDEFTIHIDKSTVLYNPYTAFFGNFETEAKATKMLNNIKKQLLVCLKGYKIKILKSGPKDEYYFRVHHVFTGKTGDLPAQTIVLQIEKILSFSLYKVYLKVKGLNPKPDSQRTYVEDFGIFGMNLDSLLGNTGSDKNTQEQEIKSVKIGNQTWMAENLNTSIFRNGDAIPQVTTMSDWDKAVAEEKPAWCYYDYDPENGKKYGKIYNWYAVKDPRGLAPTGWNIPRTFDWAILNSTLGKDAGLKMKSSSGWPPNANGNNSSGFNGLPGGVQYGGYTDPGKWGCWWSTTLTMSFLMPNSKDRDCYCLSYNSNELDSYPKSLDKGLSVRCIKD